MLTDMLKSNPSFQDMPNDQQYIYLKLAQTFQDDPDAIYCDGDELQQRFHLGTRHQWDRLLQFEPTRHFIANEMTKRTQIASRKAFLSLQREAQTGDVTAIRHLNELSGLMEKRENNKVVVLHHIPRPIQQNQKQPEGG